MAHCAGLYTVPGIDDEYRPLLFPEAEESVFLHSGDRQLGPWLTSMSAEASDMSGWMLMGLPGYAYLHGLSAFWTGIGLIIGTWANWVLVSQRLRNYTEVANNKFHHS